MLSYDIFQSLFAKLVQKVKIHQHRVLNPNDKLHEKDHPISDALEPPLVKSSTWIFRERCPVCYKEKRENFSIVAQVVSEIFPRNLKGGWKHPPATNRDQSIGKYWNCSFCRIHDMIRTVLLWYTAVMSPYLILHFLLCVTSQSQESGVLLGHQRLSSITSDQMR